MKFKRGQDHAGKYYEPDPKRRIENALDDPEGKGGPFTKDQQAEKVQQAGDDAAASQ